MRRKIEHEVTVEGRLAAVLSNLIEDMLSAADAHPGRVHYCIDFADMRDALRPYVAREILLARIAEAKTCADSDRVSALEVQLNQMGRTGLPRAV